MHALVLGITSPTSDAVGGADDAQHTVLGAALADAVGDERAVGRREEPVDGNRGVGRAGSRVDEHERSGAGIDGGPHDERRLLLTARRSVVTTTSPRTSAASTTGSSISAIRRECQMLRSGRASTA